jgi:hypothetical protein
MGVNEVDWATHSGLRRRRRLGVVTEPAPLRERERVRPVCWPVLAESLIAVVQMACVCIWPCTNIINMTNFDDGFF